MTDRIHRVTSDSKTGRKMRQAKGSRVVDLRAAAALTADQIAWNAEVERKKREKANRQFKPFMLKTNP